MVKTQEIKEIMMYAFETPEMPLLISFLACIQIKSIFFTPLYTLPPNAFYSTRIVDYNCWSFSNMGMTLPSTFLISLLVCSASDRVKMV